MRKALAILSMMLMTLAAWAQAPAATNQRPRRNPAPLPPAALGETHCHYRYHRRENDLHAVS